MENQPRFLQLEYSRYPLTGDLNNKRTGVGRRVFQAGAKALEMSLARLEKSQEAQEAGAE